MSADTLWRISLFGGLRVEAGGDSISRFRSQKIAHLLAYLALFPRRAHTREELADLFWPDADAEAGRVNLRTALSSLRRQLEPPGTLAGTVLETKGHGPVRLRPEALTTDAADFERALHCSSPSEIDLQNAVHLYRGPLLPGCYDTWALTERERLAALHLTALRGLAGLCAGRQEWAAAEGWARQAVAADPTDEAAHADVIRLLMASGQAAAARRQFDDMARLLDKELGVEPSAETRALLEGAMPKMPASGGTPPIPSALHAATPPAEGGGENANPAPPLLRARGPSAPPLLGAGGASSPLHLPLTLTRFFGRDGEIAALTDALHTCRLLTLTGPGGAGKTRTAIEAARAAAPQFTAGVWFVPLAEARESAHIWNALLAALKLPAAPGIPPLGQVGEALREKNAPVLLVLDNMEQVVDDGAGVVHRLLSEVPLLRCLVTSRQKLLLDGEQDFPLPPLPTPQHAGTPERLMEFPSVQLFVSRAQSVRPDFGITPRNAAAVAALCARLEGIPLALELAAGWAQILSPAQMLERTARRFDLLVSRRRDISPRHATLHAAIEWSYAGLPPPLQAFFAGLSVFRGGWTLDAAIVVLQEPRAPEYLAELQERSLLLPLTETGPDDAPRFRVLETLREFAGEQVGETSAALTQKHAAYFLTLAEAARTPLAGARPEEWLERLDAERDNFRAALERADPPDALRLAGLLARFWEIRGYWREGLEHLQRLLACTDAADRAACDACLGAASLARLLGEYGAGEAFCRRGLASADSLDDPALSPPFLTILGLLAQHRGQYADAQRFHEDSLARSRRLANRSACGMSLHNLGRLAELQGDAPASMGLYRDALALFRAEGDRRRESMCLSNLGNVYYMEGDFDTARRIYEQCLQMQKEMGHHAGVPISLFNLGCVHLQKEDYARAEDLFRQSLRLHAHLGNRRHVCFALEGLAAAAFRQDKVTPGVLLLSAADAQRSALHASPEWGEEALNPPAVRQQAREAQHRAVWQQGQEMTPEQALAHALTPKASRRVSAPA